MKKGFLFLLIYLLSYTSLSACPTCFAGSGEARTMFFITFLIMTALPLTMFALIFYWIRNRVKANQDDYLQG